MLRFLLVTAIVTLFCQETVWGQNSQRGRARLFQKTREEQAGQHNQNETNKQSAQNAQQRVPTPIAAPQAGPARLAAPNHADSQVPTSNRLLRAPAPTNRSSSGAAKNGFGFNVSVNERGQLFVSQLDRHGNAAEAGLRQGDLILEIGGIESSTTEEFEEIVKVMGQGDQLEFKIQRTGQSSKLSIPFGEQLEVDQHGSIASSANVQGRRYDFAPPTEQPQTLPSHYQRAESVLTHQIPNPIQAAGTGINQRFTDQNDANQIQDLNRTIALQNRQIQQLQNELNQLRRSMKRSR